MFAICALTCLFLAGPEVAPRRPVDPMLLNNPSVLWSRPDKEIIPIFLPKSVLETILPADPRDPAFVAAAKRLGLSADDAAELREQLLKTPPDSPPVCGYPIEGDIESGSAADLELSFEQTVRKSEFAAVGEVVEIIPGWIPHPTAGHVGALIRVRPDRSLTDHSKKRERPRTIFLLQEFGSLTIDGRTLCTLSPVSWQPSLKESVLVVGVRNGESRDHIWGVAYPIRDGSVSPGDVYPNADRRRLAIRELEEKR